MAIYFTQNTNNVEDIEQMNNVIDKVNQANTTATSNIGQLTDLNNKAQELSNDIQQALPINTELKENIKIGQPLVQEATTKNTELQASLEKTKEFINGLDGSQNIPQIRMDVTELQNGLKSNQALAYTGSSISADNTLEGRTEGMRIGGRTMYKKADGTYTDTWEEGVTLESFGEAEGNKISILSSNAIKIIGKYVNYANDCLQDDNYQSYVIKCDGVKNIAINLKDEEINRFGVECWKSDNFKNQQDFVGNLNYFTNKFTKQIFSPLEGTKYIKIYLSNNMPIAAKKLSIEAFVDSFPNEDYREDKKDILIKEPLRSVGDVYDVMYEDNGQVKVDRKLGKYTFTGNESIIKWADSPNACWFKIRNSFKINYGVNNSGTELLCDNFRPYNHGEFSAQTTINNSVTGITAFEDYFTIRIEKSKLSTQDVEGFKAWLKANPTTIVYQLATPVVEVVDGLIDIDLDTYQEKTYFSIENSLPGTLDFKVPSNIASIVQNTAREVNNIWDVINNLLVPSLIDINKNVAMATIKNNLK